MTDPNRPMRATDADLAAVMTDLTDEDHVLLSPPPDIWDGIAAELTAEFSAVDGGSGGNVHSLAAARARRRGVFAAAAAAVVAVAIAAGVLARGGADANVVAEAAISSEGLPEVIEPIAGDAEVVEGDDGLELRVTFDAPPEHDGFLELWMIDPNVEGMISLGVAVDGGVYPLPDGFDVAAYPIVDISIEPLDGVTTHSGRSVLRGQLVL